MSDVKKILIVEDEPKLSQLLSDYLQREMFAVECQLDGSKAVETVKNDCPDLILLDLMLPVKDGISICKEIRQFSDVPIIMTTARVEEIDRLLGLEFGADDYICKPYSPREVVARVKTVMRRSSVQSSAANSDGPVNGVVVNEASFEVLLHGQDLGLTGVEFRLFRYLFDHAGRVFSRAQLMDKLYSDGRIVTDRTVDSHIKNVRRKISLHSRDEDEIELIRSVYGVGYRYDG